MELDLNGRAVKVGVETSTGRLFIKLDDGRSVAIQESNSGNIIVRGWDDPNDGPIFKTVIGPRVLESG